MGKKIDWHEKNGVLINFDHTIAKSKDINALKKMVKFTLNGDKAVLDYKRDVLIVRLLDEDLGESFIAYRKTAVNKALILKCAEEIFDKKYLVKDESRVIKREQNKIIVLKVLVSAEQTLPMIIVDDWNYIVAPAVVD